MPAAEPVKKRGRPPGSKNKATVVGAGAAPSKSKSPAPKKNKQAEEAEGPPGARPKREQVKKPVYTAPTLPSFGGRMPKTKAKKPGQQKPARGRPPKGDKPGGAKPRGWANQWGSSRRGDDDGPARPGRNRSRGNTNEPLLKVAKDAEDWGWKHTVALGTPLCPLYYGCPARPMYFCCERHKALWAGGVQEMERMPPEWKLSAPDPDWAAEFVGGRKMAEEEAKAKAAPSGYRSMGMASVHAATAWALPP